MADPSFRYTKKQYQGPVLNGQQAAASPPAQSGVQPGAYTNPMIGQPGPTGGMQGQANPYPMPYGGPAMPQNAGQMPFAGRAPAVQQPFPGGGPVMPQGAGPAVQQMPYGAVPAMPQNAAKMGFMGGAPAAQQPFPGGGPGMPQGAGPAVQQMPYGAMPAMPQNAAKMGFMGGAPAAQQPYLGGGPGMPQGAGPAVQQMPYGAMGGAPAVQQRVNGGAPFIPQGTGQMPGFGAAAPFAGQQMNYGQAQIPGGGQVPGFGAAAPFAGQQMNYGQAQIPGGGQVPGFGAAAPFAGQQMNYGQAQIPGGGQMPFGGGVGQPWNQQKPMQMPGQGYSQGAFQGMQNPVTVSDVIVRTFDSNQYAPPQSAGQMPFMGGAPGKPNLPAKTGFQVAYGIPPPTVAPKVEHKPVPLRLCNACKQQVPETEIYSKKCADANCNVCCKCVNEAYLVKDSPTCPACQRDYSEVELIEIHQVLQYTPEYKGRAGDFPKKPGAGEMVTCVFGHETNKTNLIQNACPQGCLVCRQHYQEVPKCVCGQLLGMHINGDIRQFAA